MVDTNEAYKPSQRWILLVGLGSLVWARLKTVYLTTILGLENNNSFPTLKSLPAAARLPVISQSKLFSTRQRIRNPSVKLKDSYTYLVEPTISKQVAAPPVEYIQLFEPVENSCFFGIIEDPSEPLTFAEANAHPGWRAAMKFERDSLMKNHTWELWEPPPGIKPVTAKWIYKTKIGADGQPSKLKARLVARRFQQTKGIDFDEVFASVAKWKAVRMVVALAVSNDWILFHLDMVTTFLNGDLKEIVYMEVPEGFRNSSTSNKVCRLIKSLFGLRQAPRTWFKKIQRFLSEQGLSHMKADYSLFYVSSSKGIIILILYVDDLLVTGSDNDGICSLKQKLMQRFDMIELGNVTYYLGVEFIRSNFGIFLSQKAYASQILSEFNMAACTPASVPMVEGSHLGVEDDSPKVDARKFQRLVGMLIYLVNTKPKILYATGVLSRYMHDPRVPHMEAAYHVLRYIKGALDFGILYCKDHSPTMIGYTDADWGNYKIDRKSITGWVFTSAGGPISWSSKKQQTVAISSTDAEAKALTDGIREAIWLRTLSTKIHGIMPNPITLFYDNQSTLKAARNPVHHEQLKHIELWLHFIRENVVEDTVETLYIQTCDQITDIFTKPLGKQRFIKLRDEMGIKSISSLREN